MRKGRARREERRERERVGWGDYTFVVIMRFERFKKINHKRRILFSLKYTF